MQAPRCQHSTKRDGPRLLILFLAATLLGSSVGPVLGHPASQHQLSALAERIVEDPEDPAPHLTRANLWRQGAHWSEALADLELAETKGGDPLVISLGRIDAYRGLERWDDALAAADQALALDPRLIGARRSRGSILTALGRHQAAARELALAFDHFENPAPALVVELAAALQAAGRVDEARHHLDFAMGRFGPRNVLLRRALSLELASRGRAAAEQRFSELTGRRTPHQQLLWAEVLAAGEQPGAAREVLCRLLTAGAATGERLPRGAQRLQRRAHETLESLDVADASCVDSLLPVEER